MQFKQPDTLKIEVKLERRRSNSDNNLTGFTNELLNSQANYKDFKGNDKRSDNSTRNM